MTISVFAGAQPHGLRRSTHVPLARAATAHVWSRLVVTAAFLASIVSAAVIVALFVL